MNTHKQKKSALYWMLFLFAALASAAVLFGLFELRYMWYVSRENFIFLRSIFGASLIAIILLWALFPSRILVALIAVACFALPPLLRGGTFVQLDATFIGWVAACTLLLVGTTELRRRLRRA